MSKFCIICTACTCVCAWGMCHAAYIPSDSPGTRNPKLSYNICHLLACMTQFIIKSTNINFYTGYMFDAFWDIVVNHQEDQLKM